MCRYRINGKCRNVSVWHTWDMNTRCPYDGRVSVCKCVCGGFLAPYVGVGECQ